MKSIQLLAREEAAAREKREGMLAAVCHDVQQPLTVILGQADLLKRQLARGEPISPERLEASLANIQAAATRMRGMTQDLLDASVLQSGYILALQLARTELVALVKRAVVEHELQSDAHHFHFESELPALEATIDEPRLHRVLTNLLANAVKYSPAGGAVRVTINAIDAGDGTRARIAVRDEGLGIPSIDLPHIFDRFYRGSNVAGPYAGTGLGLASARELVELHGGTLSADSEEGKGSTFVVHLPLAPPSRRHTLV